MPRQGLDSSSLANWITDLDKRLIFIRQWIRDGPPLTMPLGLLMAPNVFLASIVQSHALKYNIPIGTIRFDCQVLAQSRRPGDNGAGEGKVSFGGVAELPHSRALVAAREVSDSQGAGGPEFLLDVDKDVTLTDDGFLIPKVSRGRSLIALS